MVKYCPECAHPIIDSKSQFCPKCGVKFPVICPGCAHPIIVDNSQFCPKCGMKLPITFPEVQPPAARSTTVQQPNYPSYSISPASASPPSVHIPAQQQQNPIVENPTQKRSTFEWIAICCGGIILLVIVSALITGMSSAPNSGSNNPSTSATLGSFGTTDLNSGDTAIINYNGNTESVKVNYNQSADQIEVSIKNLGNAAIIDDTKIYMVDYGGVKYNPFYVGPSTANPLYPGESISSEVEMEGLFLGHGDSTASGVSIQRNAMRGKLTLFCTFGDNQASWIIKPS